MHSETYDLQRGGEALLLGRRLVVGGVTVRAVGETAVGVGALDGTVGLVENLLSLLDEGLDSLD